MRGRTVPNVRSGTDGGRPGTEAPAAAAPPLPRPEPVSRPPAIVALVVALALAPALQLASVAGWRVLNFAPDRPWNYLAYGVAAPYVALLLWRRHPRARFAAYVFLTHEAARGVHLHRGTAVAVAAAWLLVLQLPSARRYAPSLRPAEIRARLSRRLPGRR